MDIRAGDEIDVEAMPPRTLLVYRVSGDQVEANGPTRSLILELNCL